MKILATKWRRLGDTILWSSALEALLQHFPESTVHLALPAEYDALYAADSRFQTRFQLKSDTAVQTQLKAIWREQRYDWFLGFHASDRVRRLARFCGAKRQILHHHSRRPRVFGSSRRVVDLGKVMSAIDRDLNVVRTLGWSGKPPPTKLVVSDQWRKQAQELWRSKSSKPIEDIVLVSPAASRPAKQWPLERYARLIEKLSKRATVGVIAESPAVFAGRTHFLGEIEKQVPVFFTPLLEQAMGLLSLTHVFVGADSGLKHMAIALGAKTVTLFGPESVGEWHPYERESHTAIQNKVGCRQNDAEDPQYAWCGVEVCPLASHACLSLTSPEQVYDATLRYL